MEAHILVFSLSLSLYPYRSLLYSLLHRLPFHSCLLFHGHSLPHSHPMNDAVASSDYAAATFRSMRTEAFGIVVWAPRPPARNTHDVDDDDDVVGAAIGSVAMSTNRFIFTSLVTLQPTAPGCRPCQSGDESVPLFIDLCSNPFFTIRRRCGLGCPVVSGTLNKMSKKE